MFEKLTYRQKRNLMDILYRASSRNFAKCDLRLATGDPRGSFDLYEVGTEIYEIATDIYRSAYQA